LVDRFFRAFTASRQPLLLIDYDGTLAPFHIDRFQAEPWPGIRPALQLIQNQKKTRIIVITGRPAAEIAPLLGLTGPVEVWGLHGFEHLSVDGRRELEELPGPVRQKLDQLITALRRDSFGGLLEEKPNAVVLHWRGAAPSEAKQIDRRARALFEPAAQELALQLLPFEAGLELRAGRNKGAAAEMILNECAKCAPVTYLGDDITDEAAFRALKGRGLSVLVRPELRETAADVWLKPPDELKQFLDRWSAACEAISDH
jgi:trehalose 6-phosphate phosphatase